MGGASVGMIPTDRLVIKVREFNISFTKETFGNHGTGGGHLRAHAGEGHEAETAHSAGAMRACEAVDEDAAAASKGCAHEGEERGEEVAHGAAGGIDGFPPRRHVEAQVRNRFCAADKLRKQEGENPTYFCPGRR